MTGPHWEERLARWLAGGVDLEIGAELEVRDPDGTVVFLAPLARHYRIEDEDDSHTLWIRPIVGGYAPEREPGEPLYAFSLNEARARALSLADVRVEDDEIVFDLGDQVAGIREAGPETMPELERWDTFFYTVLDAEEEAALDRVWGDSYYGRWA